MIDLKFRGGEFHNQRGKCDPKKIPQRAWMEDGMVVAKEDYPCYSKVVIFAPPNIIYYEYTEAPERSASTSESE